MKIGHIEIIAANDRRMVAAGRCIVVICMMMHVHATAPTGFSSVRVEIIDVYSFATSISCRTRNWRQQIFRYDAD